MIDLTVIFPTIRGTLFRLMPGRYAEAASWVSMALQDNPDYQPGLRIAAPSNAMARRIAASRAAGMTIAARDFARGNEDRMTSASGPSGPS
ncbi:hypothetical protein IVB43_01700 [Bradyrhizobium sp. 48]|uniref:hypothetical protein n=1 Tax=Bradyrhizobium sp. 48 TaxID=2782676 RepID=UPI001FFAE482|nr:hypothetical protein [Bradyrhizobium sp. 48]MCK1441117.1 hypothetical protein [Bradyrhizobium sp. 48]